MQDNAFPESCPELCSELFSESRTESSPELRRSVQRWIDQDPDADTAAALARLVDRGDWCELGRLFAGRIAFGTAGLRAELGPGPLRMNRLVVRQTAAGLVAELLARHEATGTAGPVRLVVGHDARHGSAAFAAETIAVARAGGVHTLAFDRSVPTPVLAYTVRARQAAAGVMVTASHNPARDNGYKVYLADGAQLVAPHDRAIAARIDAAAQADVSVDPGVATELLGSAAIDAYVAAILTQLPAPHRPRLVKVAYSALCGVGGKVACQAFAAAGFSPIEIVRSQQRPDPDFTGLPFPNPEEPGVMAEVMQLARSVGADVAFANDPDADRLGVALPTASGAFRALSGNEIGALLADHLLRFSAADSRSEVGDDRLVVSTVVSSRLVASMARAAGVRFAETLTGFKWIVRPALEHPHWRFVFGYEEALGFAVGPVVRDKDGIAAALVFAELTAALKAEGSSPLQRLDELAVEHGLHLSDQVSIRFADRDRGGAAIDELMAAVRSSGVSSFAGSAISARRDLARPTPGDGLAATDAVIWDLADGARLVFRPSGTEPKLKVYLEVIEPVPGAAADAVPVARAAAQRRLDALVVAVRGLLRVV